jgi:hypothetical protein
MTGEGSAATKWLWVGWTSQSSPLRGFFQVSTYWPSAVGTLRQHAEALDAAQHLRGPVDDVGEDVAAEPAVDRLRRIEVARQRHEGTEVLGGVAAVEG